MSMSKLNEELFEAIRKDNVDWAKESVSKGAKLTSIDGDGHTVLHEAASAGSVNVMHWLIREGQNSDLSEVDEDGNTPFHTAAFEGQIEALKTLYEYDNSCIRVTNNANETVADILKEWYPELVTEWEQFLKKAPSNFCSSNENEDGNLSTHNNHDK